MKVEFLTQDDPLYVLPFFEEFLKACPPEMEILQVSSSRAMGKRSRSRLFQELFLLYGGLGLARIAARVARARIFNLLPRPRGAERYDTLAQLCRSYRVNYASIGTPNDRAFLQRLKDRDPDVIISVACPYILNREVLALPPKGCINIHHAPLPRYKGMMPTFWQMFHGEQNVGITIHYMNTRLDEGESLLQDSLEILSGESLDHLIRRSKRHGAHCMVRVLQQLNSSTQRSVPLDGADSTYFTFPTTEEIEQFHRRGLRAI